MRTASTGWMCFPTSGLLHVLGSAVCSVVYSVATICRFEARFLLRIEVGSVPRNFEF